MKYINSLFLFVLGIFIFISCSKDGPADTQVPQSFQKRILLEIFSGEWCPPCATVHEDYVSPLLEEYPERVIPVSHHLEDPFASSESSFLADIFKVIGIPQGMVDRYGFQGEEVLGLSFLTERVPSRLESSTVPFGIQIESSGDRSTLDINIGIVLREAISNDTYLNVYLIEDEVPSFNQQGTTDPDYRHKVVFRESLQSFPGKPIDENVVDEIQSFTFTLNPDINKFEDGYIVAFLQSEGEVLQVQQAKMGSQSDW